MQPFRIPTRPLLKSFWLTLSLTAGILAAVVLWWLTVERAVLWAAGFTALASAAGLRWPMVARRPYETWERLGRKARRAARLWLSGVVFLILLVIGRMGARLPWSRPDDGASGWTRKRPLATGSYTVDSDLAQAAGSDAAWGRRFAEWGWRSGNVWAWSLIPLLALLRGVEGDSRGSLGGNVYTLY